MWFLFVLNLFVMKCFDLWFVMRRWLLRFNIAVEVFAG